MATIKLHTPHHNSDKDTITEYEANDIFHVVSVIGNDECQGTHFYVRHLGKRQFCLESAREVKQLIAAHKDAPMPQVVGGTHIHVAGDFQGNVVNTVGDGNRINVNATTNQQFNDTLTSLSTAVASSDLEGLDKDEIDHVLQRVKRLAEGEQTAKSKTSVLEKLEVVEKMVTVSDKLSKIALPWIVILRAHFGAW